MFFLCTSTVFGLIKSLLAISFEDLSSARSWNISISPGCKYGIQIRLRLIGLPDVLAYGHDHPGADVPEIIVYIIDRIDEFFNGAVLGYVTMYSSLEHFDYYL